MTTFFSDHTHLGGLQIQKTAGQISPGEALATVHNIAIVGADPRNPYNFAYPPVTNASAGPVNGVQGKRTPFFPLTTCAKSSWFTAQLLNDLIGGTNAYLDTGLNTSEYALNLSEPILGNRRFSNCKCAGLDIDYIAAGGPVMVNMTFTGLYGDDEGTPPSFSAYSRDAGLDIDTSLVAITGADQIDRMTVSLVRVQQNQLYSNGTLYGTAVTSGGIGGIVTIYQSATFTQTASTTITFQVGAVSLQFAINLDNPVKAWSMGRSTWVKQYSMVDFSGTFASGYPCLIT